MLPPDDGVPVLHAVPGGPVPSIALSSAAIRRRSILTATAAMVGATALGSLLSACGKSPPSFDNLDISGNSGFEPAFSIADTNGQMRTIADYKGKVVVLFFGYTQCPDVCPTSLAELAQAKKQLGADGAKLQVILVSVDPERDTPAILAQYVAAFDPSFVALRPADDAAVARLAKQFHIVVKKTPATANAPYAIEHSAASFVYDPSGRLRLYARDGQGVDRWLHDIKILANEPNAAGA